MSDNPLSTENTSSLVNRAKAIIMTPTTEWPRIAAEAKSPKEVLLQYALPLIAIGPICSILGSFLATYSLGLTFSIATAVVSFVLSIVSLYLLSFIANFLSSNFGGKNDFPSAFKLVAYSYTPAWIAGVLGLVTGIVPGLGFLALIALCYGLYLFYLGTTPVMSVPQDKAIGYVVIYVVSAIVLYLIIGAITTSIVLSMVVPASPALTITYQ
ncbi:MAG: Yip1 family protein [Candidatus Andeanibacterium colombiense]|uniref:Yip1 family protein n=1 Tax=Candidatus Andeanibacterium colombiense TaxID=3121345 RepID=A0AAJ5X6I0_9SPHN|nr:MAG: Yip1 family protein [Sphingomonadaceae bacterium]